MLTAFINATIFSGSEIISGKALVAENDKIVAITDPSALPSYVKNIDCGGNYIAPGLIDLQIAGGGGYLFSDNPSTQALEIITESIVKSGTTGFLIAMPTNSMEVYFEAIRVIKENPHPAIMGLHLEGPYINIEKSGAHTREYIRKPKKKEVELLLAKAEGTIKMITLAPEMCSQDIIKLFSDNGVIVAAGHSNATYIEAISGFKNGVRSVTHLFNAMSPLHHRDPGLPGAAFMTENICASIIADGIHVDFNILSLCKSIMKERLFLVSDAVEECRHGAYLHIRHEDRFTLPDGTLSGSALSMLKAVENCVRHVNIPPDEALRMASTYPSKLINATGRGLIKKGFNADFIIFSKDFHLKSVFINGVSYGEEQDF